MQIRPYIRQLARIVAPALFYTLAACLASWPLALHLRTHLPIGSEAPATVALFNLWTLRWNAERLLAGYAGYWHAPIFHPQPGAFALSEPQPATGLIFTPLWLLVGDEVLAYNLVLLLALAANGAAAERLITTLGLARGAARLAGALAVGLPFVAYELGVLQLAMLFPIWLALDALARFRLQPTLRPALALGLWLALTFLTCEYYGAFAIVVLGVGGLVLLGRGLGRAAIGNLLIGLALAVLMLLAVLPAQARLSAGFVRSAATIAQNSAQAADYLRLPPGALGASLPWLRAGGGSGQTLYPGSGLLLLALAGMAVGWRTHRRWVACCVVAGGVALLLSFGPNLTLAGWAPYQLLRAVTPGFRQLRSPFRLAALLQVLLLILSGLALARLWAWRAPHGRWLAVALALLTLSEVWLVPAPLYRFPRERLHEPWIAWLAAQPPGALAVVPFPASGAAGDYERTTIAMLQALGHRHPLANGYSGFFPPAYLQLRAAMLSFPDPASLRALRDMGVLYVVVDHDWAGPARQAQIDQLRAELQPVFADAAAQLYRLSRATPHGPPQVEAGAIGASSGAGMPASTVSWARSLDRPERSRRRTTLTDVPTRLAISSGASWLYSAKVRAVRWAGASVASVVRRLSRSTSSASKSSPAPSARATCGLLSHSSRWRSRYSFERSAPSARFRAIPASQAATLKPGSKRAAECQAAWKTS